MDLHQFLLDRTTTILAEATNSMARSHVTHYEQSGADHTHQRLKALFVLTARAVQDRNLAPMAAHADTIARERFTAGFDLWEVQTALNVLEEVIWKMLLKEFPSAELPEALGLVSTILGVGKDTLARRYVSLAAKMRVSSFNLQSLFHGLDA